MDQILCRVCSSVVQPKFRRLIFNAAFKVKEQLAEVLLYNPSPSDGLSEYICFKCWGRLNKLSKIDFDLHNKLTALEQEKKTIIGELRNLLETGHNSKVKSVFPSRPRPITITNPSLSVEFTSVTQQEKATLSVPNTTTQTGSSNLSITPVKSPWKRKRYFLTPTPRKLKRRSIIFETEPSTSVCKPVARKKLADKLISPNKAKIIFRSATEHRNRTKIVRDKEMHAVLLSIARGDKKTAIAKKLCKVPELKENIIMCVAKTINQECQDICKLKNPSILRRIDPNSLLSLQFKDIVFELQLRAPSLFQVLQASTNKDDAAIAVVASTILRKRNQQMSSFHHIVGQILDHGGATDETINILSHLGLAVGPDTVANKRSELMEKQKERINEAITARVLQTEQLYKVEQTKTMITNLAQDTEVTNSSDYTQKPTQTVTEQVHPYFDTVFRENPPTRYSVAQTHHLTVTDSKAKFLPAPSVCEQDVKFALRGEKTSFFGNTFNTVQATAKHTLQYGKAYIEKHADLKNPKNRIPTFEIIGDNIDITKSPSQMTKERQRESLHWFMNIAVQRRVLYNDADNNTDVTDIMDVPTSAFLPSREDLNSLDKNMAFHIIKVATKNIDCLKKYRVPDHIIHPYISELSKKSTFFIVDLLDKSENKAEDMMSILEEVHKKYIPHSDIYPASVIEKNVFGGDVLTNERAHTAQLNMLNGETDFYRLDGVIHRPEGLHRMMNFLLVSTFFG